MKMVIEQVLVGVLSPFESYWKKIIAWWSLKSLPHHQIIFFIQRHHSSIPYLQVQNCKSTPYAIVAIEIPKSPSHPCDKSS